MNIKSLTLCKTKRFSDLEEKEKGEGLINAKKFYATFVSLMLAIVMLMCTVVIVHADVYPGVPPYPAHPGKLMPVVGDVPEWGYYGGYHPMWNLIMPSLTSTIGFSTANPGGNYWPMADDWSFWDVIWDDPGWQYSTQDISYDVIAPHGWDLTAFEWWTMPTGQLWNDGIILAENLPPTGFNIFPYINDKADNLYWAYQASNVPATRKARIDEWQFELMRNPVMANVYFPTIWEVYGSYINNFYGTTWWYEIDNLAINFQNVTDTYNLGYMSLTERNRLLAGTVKWGLSEDWWNYNPAFIATYTEETMAQLITGTLYTMSISPWPTQGTIPYPGNYYSKPDLASGMPVMSPDGLTATIYLKDNIWWSDGHKFDSGDVKYTLDLNLIPAAKAVGRGDFAPIVSAVDTWGPLAVNLTLVRPYNDLANILSNSWGLSIVPEHYYSSIAISALRGHVSNSDWTVHKDVPYLGPFHLVDVTTAYLKYEKHPGWWGNSTAGYGYTIHDTINTIYLEKVEDASTRLAKLETHELDFAEYPTAPTADMIALRGTPGLTVFERPYCASNGVWFNINNPYLSNRYVRLAISYAIPYATIRSTILPSWGVQSAITRGNLVHPWQYYGGIQLFNTKMPPYTYNPAWAQAYLDMWKLSRIAHAPANMTGEDWSAGPVGDADFSGFVDLDDFLKVWALYVGQTEAYMDGATLAGNDVDADFNNDDIVDDVDYDLWAPHIGYYYPDRSTTQTMPY